jgi:hypothetical protein
MVYELPSKDLTAAGGNDTEVTPLMRHLELPPPERNRPTGE